MPMDEYGTDRPTGGMILHRVELTDTLGSLAKHYYGDPGMYDLILCHNTAYIPDPNHLQPGITLAIPYHSHLRAKVVPLQ